MNDKRMRNYWLIILVIGALLVMPTVTKAEGLGYSVKAIIPDNQIDKDQTFFDLLMKPGAKQKLELEIISSSKEALQLEIEPNIATTNQNGELEYSVEPEKVDDTLSHPITNLLSGKQSLTLAPLETKVVTFNLTMPEESFKGKLVGAFNIGEREEDQVKKHEQKSDVQISNIMSMGIGIQLRESMDAVKPELKLNTVRANLFNYRTAITANLQNTEAEFLGDLKVHAIVRKTGSTEILYESEKSDMSMAPNSNFDFVIPLENQEIEKGNYELELLATSKDKEWAFKKKFNITSDEAKKLNDEAVELVKKDINWLLILQIILILIFILVIIVMLVKLSQERKAKERRRKR